MSEATTFTVDPEAAAAAAAGDIPYVPEGSGDPATEDREFDPKTGEPVVPEEKPTPTDDTEDAQATDDETKEGEEPTDDEAKEDAEGDKVAEEEFTVWFDEYNTSGELSAESAQTAMDQVFHPNLSPEMKEQLLRQFLGGIDSGKGIAHLNTLGLTGGTQESFDGMVTWAKETLSETERAEFDKQAASSPEAEKLAIEGLYARYAQATGVNVEPSLGHDADAGNAEPAIASRQELRQIVGSERYNNDPAFREKIDRQLGQSLKSGRYRT